MYYIITPIPYVNGDPHLGHLLETVFNDSISRYRRRVYAGEVRFSLGADQHGLKNLQKAQEMKQTPEEFVHAQAEKFQKIWREYEITNDVFTETESREHKLVSQIIWQKLQKKSYIYKKTYTGLYCVGCEDFYAPSQLNEKGCCPIHLTKPVEMTEENYFFKLSVFTDIINEFLQNAWIVPNSVRGEWLAFVDRGLEDISISRESARLPWGIAVPEDETQVMYVWFEALINYLTGLVNLETVDRYFEFPLLQESIKEEIWQDILDGLPIDFMYLGKDIAKFHLVIWIGMLSALGLPLPLHSLVHGFINDAKGHKMSKSLGNVITPAQIVEKFGIDGTRFIMLHEVNINSDTNFDWKQVVASYNANLADNLGNLVVRVSNLIEKYLGGVVDTDKVYVQSENQENEYFLDVSLQAVYQGMEQFNPQRALQQLFVQSAKINQFLEQTRPWSLAKDMEKNQDNIKLILGQSAKSLLEIAKCLSIFLPESGEKIYKVFSSERITKAEILFTKIVEEESL